jgi:hypothetical protein
MTTLLKAVRRETGASVREQGKLRAIVLEAHGGFMVLRAKGLRRGYSLDYHTAYVMAVRAAVEEQRRVLKAEKRKQK